MSWSCDGKMLACLSRDHIIRIYEPRISTEAIKVKCVNIQIFTVDMSVLT